MTLTFLISKGEYTTCALHSTQYFTCVQPPGVRVATTAVHKHIGLHPPLSGLLWHVLNEVQPLLKPVIDYQWQSPNQGCMPLFRDHATIILIIS